AGPHRRVAVCRAGVLHRDEIRVTNDRFANGVGGSRAAPPSSLRCIVKRIAILGSTGSIGQSALSVVDAHADRLQVVGLAAGENADLLAAQVVRYRPAIAAMATGVALDRLKENALAGVTFAGTGREGLVAVA